MSKISVYQAGFHYVHVLLVNGVKVFIHTIEIHFSSFVLHVICFCAVSTKVQLSQDFPAFMFGFCAILTFWNIELLQPCLSSLDINGALCILQILCAVYNLYCSVQLFFWFGFFQLDFISFQLPSAPICSFQFLKLFIFSFQLLSAKNIFFLLSQLHFRYFSANFCSFLLFMYICKYSLFMIFE